MRDTIHILKVTGFLFMLSLVTPRCFVLSYLLKFFLMSVKKFFIVIKTIIFFYRSAFYIIFACLYC